MPTISKPVPKSASSFFKNKMRPATTGSKRSFSTGLAANMPRTWPSVTTERKATKDHFADLQDSIDSLYDVWKEKAEESGVEEEDEYVDEEQVSMDAEAADKDAPEVAEAANDKDAPRPLR
ncbi:uncharacterized protein LTR77_008700 [Saxophila tyrrhenica]|uniref:Uncharacterized protein n=1 Tax=Saxophila tyrrhenica TaxID=1690608 RepID=A0AAV9P0T2_9PEZI|nr:hypothetical protein LTR77_008700 [Saxophila tyrrhenica]